jgi:hypothetical protein
MRVRNRILLVAVIWVCSGSATAADGPGVSVYSTAPAALAAGPCASPSGCATSGTGLSRFTAGWRGVPDCNGAQCDKSRFHKSKPPYTVNLCPGACFGYFQTQWRSWNDVCPHPYDGGIVSDPMKPPIPPANKNGDVVPPPRPVDPKTGMGMPPPGMGPLPSIPPYPGPSRY